MRARRMRREYFCRWMRRWRRRCDRGGRPGLPPTERLLLAAGDLHRLDVVAHVHLREVRDLLIRHEGDLGALEVLLGVGLHVGVRADDETFDIVVPVSAGDIL